MTLRRPTIAAAPAASQALRLAVRGLLSIPANSFTAVGRCAFGVWLCLFACVGLGGAGRARAEDPAQRAAQIRDEILAKRRSQSERGGRQQALEREMDQARARADRIRADLDAAAERIARVDAQHARIVAKLADLDAATQRQRSIQRTRLAAMYRAADLGAGAAGWQSGFSAESIRLARYLVAAASRGGSETATLEVQRGSNLAALNQSGVDRQRVLDEQRRLQDSRVIAESDLARAQSRREPADSSAGFGSAEATAGLAAVAAELERKSADGARQGRAQVSPGLQQDSAPGVSTETKALADRKAQATDTQALLAEARMRAAAAQARDQAGSARKAGADTVRAQPQGSTFDWSEQAAGASRGESAGSLAMAGRGGAPGAGDLNGGPGRASSIAPGEGASARQSGAAAPADAAQAPATAPAAEASGAGAQGGVLSHQFGSDSEEAKRFASSKGSLVPPLAGRVVAKFGQRNGGSTYRGVVVRGDRGSSVRSVAGGTVLFAGSLPNLGSTLIVSHGGRYHAVYARLGSLRFKVGDHVNAGDVVGTLPADDGDLHFEMRLDGHAIDPLPWLKGSGRDLSR